MLAAACAPESTHCPHAGDWASLVLAHQSRYPAMQLDDAYKLLHQATMEFLLHAPRFHLEMEGRWLLLRRDRRFGPEDFREALRVGEGVLDRLPEYLLRELKGADA